MGSPPDLKKRAEVVARLFGPECDSVETRDMVQVMQLIIDICDEIGQVQEALGRSD